MDELTIPEYLGFLQPADESDEDDDPEERRQQTIADLDRSPRVIAARVRWLEDLVVSGQADAMEPFELEPGRRIESPDSWIRELLSRVQAGEPVALVELKTFGRIVRNLQTRGDSPVTSGAGSDTSNFPRWSDA